MASAPKHTPGEWRAVPPGCKGSPDQHRYTIVAPSGLVVAMVLDSLDEDEANAWVLAAAPEMLDVLKTTASNLRSIAATTPGVKTYEKWLAVVEATIARAGAA